MTKIRTDQSAIDWKTRYQDLLSSLNVGVVLFDMDYGCLEVNEAFLKMVGGTRAEYVGSNARAWYPPDEFKKLNAIVEPLESLLKNHQFEFYVYHKQGERIPVLFNASYNLDSEGRPESATVLFTDIGDQKRAQAELESKNRDLLISREKLEKEKRKLEAILFGIGDCVTIFDPNGSIILGNPQGMAIRGKRQTPLLPLKSGFQKEIAIEIGGEEHRFIGKVEAIRDHRGEAYAYAEILKDVTDHLKLKEKENELFRMRRKVGLLEVQSEMIGVSRPIRDVFEFILRCAEVDSTVLIHGESGVGKEMAAKAVYAQSVRKNKPFVAVNCGALPEPLLESELFGHVRGAFTGAVTERKGLLREAQGGVLLLDEVGDLPLLLQTKLLRALQEKEIRPVGDSQTHHVDVRVIATTNKRLEDLVKMNRFRRDLYYRLAVIPLFIPPLRERKEDILPLAEHFVKKHGTKTKRAVRALDHAAQQMLLEYSWPGNIRELENCIEHALAMAQGPLIKPIDLPVHIVINQNPIQEEARSPFTRNHILEGGTVSDSEIKQGGDLYESSQLKPWEMEEKKVIFNALLHNKGNRARTASALGISRTTLWRKMALYKIFL